MNAKLRKIEVDAATADILERHAAERGVTVAKLVAELTDAEWHGVQNASDQIAELDRRWNRIAAGERTTDHAHVVRWLESWGTSAYAPIVKP
jgi:predicted DNA-binding ribbon-helix-helix protein